MQQISVKLSERNIDTQPLTNYYNYDLYDRSHFGHK